jgi:translocation and assembly module TamB
VTPASEDQYDETAEAPLSVSRAGRLSGVALLAVAVATSGVWIARRPIATHLVDQTLAARGVPASYQIDDLGLGRQRLTDLVIGDPAHPDLVADWVEVHTVLGLHGAHVTGLTAGHVRLRGKLVDGRVSLGMIDRLLPPPSGKPFALPHLDLAVQDGRMRLETPAGRPQGQRQRHSRRRLFGAARRGVAADRDRAVRRRSHGDGGHDPHR